MCLNEECKWITMIEDNKQGKRCIIHYRVSETGRFEELLTEGDVSLKSYIETLRDNNYFEKQDIMDTGILSVQGCDYSPFFPSQLDPNLTTITSIHPDILLVCTGNMMYGAELSARSFNSTDSDEDMPTRITL